MIIPDAMALARKDKEFLIAGAGGSKSKKRSLNKIDFDVIAQDSYAGYNTFEESITLSLLNSYDPISFISVISDLNLNIQADQQNICNSTITDELSLNILSDQSCFSTYNITVNLLLSGQADQLCYPTIIMDADLSLSSQADQSYSFPASIIANLMLSQLASILNISILNKIALTDFQVLSNILNECKADMDLSLLLSALSRIDFDLDIILPFIDLPILSFFDVSASIIGKREKFPEKDIFRHDKSILTRHDNPLIDIHDENLLRNRHDRSILRKHDKSLLK